jgi:hypothetical protein
MNRLLALTALAVVLAAGLIGVTGARQSAMAAQQSAMAAQQPDQICILGIICLPGGSSSPTASPSAPSPTPSPTSASPSPTGSPSSPDPSPSTGPTPSPGAASSPGSTPSAGPAVSASPSASGTATAAKQAAAKQAAATPGLVLSAAGSVLTAGSATMTGFVYQGNVDMPVAGGGTVAMMKFTADSITLAGGVTESVTQDGVTTMTTSPTLAFSGNVTLYATKLSGSLGIIPLTFTPSTISGILLNVANLITGVLPITMTGVTTDQPLVSAGALQTGSLAIGG